ncbi:MAG: hypothetical protein ABI720_05265 [Actinomycetes bacterium]
MQVGLCLRLPGTGPACLVARTVGCSGGLASGLGRLAQAVVGDVDGEPMFEVLFLAEGLVILVLAVRLLGVIGFVVVR